MKLSALFREVGAVKIAASVRPKTAEMDSLLRSVGLVADDAAILLARKLFRTGDKLMMVPQAVSKVQQINDPTVERSPEIATARKIMSLVGKVASLRVPQAPETTAKWDIDTKRIGQAFNSAGPAFKASPADQPNIGTGDFPKSAIDGNTNVPFMEQGLNRPITATAGVGALDPAANASRAFDRLRMVSNGTGTPNMDGGNAA